MTRPLYPLLLTALLGGCKADDPTGTWTGSAQTSVFGVRTDYELDIDIVADDDGNLSGEGVLLTDGVPADVTLEGEQKRSKIEFELFPLGADFALDTKYKGKIHEDLMDGKLSVGVSLAKVRGDMTLRRQE